MAFSLGSIGGNLFRGGTGNFGGGGGGFDWGSVAGAGITKSIGGLAGGTAKAATGGGLWSSIIGGLTGGSGGGGSSNIWQGLLGGLGAAAQGYMDEKAVKEAGKQQRQSIGYTAELEDFYKQKDKARKRAALDTYGQFSLMSRYAPTANRVVPLDQPVKPSTG